MRLVHKCFLVAPIVFGVAQAQLGDNKDKKGTQQVDPIPAENIPAAPILSTEQALKTFELKDGFVLEVVAEGEQVVQPVHVTFDADGRAWVAEMTEYMRDVDGSSEGAATGRIKVLEDLDGDGVTDKTTVFVDGLVLPRTVAVTSDGALFNDGDALYFQKRSGLKPVGERMLVDKTYAVGGNPEHKANGMIYARDNWYYNAKSDRSYRRVDGKWVMRKTGFRGQWGIGQDDDGFLYFSGNSTPLMSNPTRPALFNEHRGMKPRGGESRGLGGNRLYPSRMNPGVNRAYRKGTLNAEGKLVRATAAAGGTVYRGQNFPEEFYGRGFTTSSAAGLLRMLALGRDDFGRPTGKHMLDPGNQEFLTSTDEWFRPVALSTAPDGTLWVVDMASGMIQHKAFLTSYLRRQYESRGLDKPAPDNGRIYRVRYAKTPASKVPKLSGKSVAELVSFLSHPNGTVRDITQRLIVERLGEHPSFAKEWEQAIQKQLGRDTSARLRVYALWIYEALGQVPASLLREGFASKHPGFLSSALELAHLAEGSVADDLLAFEPSLQSWYSYMYALGTLGSSESHTRAAAVLGSAPKDQWIDYFYLSGLGGKAASMPKVDLAESPRMAALFAKLEAQQSKKKSAKKALSGDQKKRFEHGKGLYFGSAGCAGCHGNQGQGMEHMAPPLNQSEWVTGDKEVLIKVLLHGLTGPIKVAGKRYKFPLVMPGIGQRSDLKDEDLAALLTYIRNFETNDATPVSAKEVAKVRAATKARNQSPYSAGELGK